MFLTSMLKITAFIILPNSSFFTICLYNRLDHLLYDVDWFIYFNTNVIDILAADGYLTTIWRLSDCQITFIWRLLDENSIMLKEYDDSLHFSRCSMNHLRWSILYSYSFGMQGNYFTDLGYIQRFVSLHYGHKRYKLFERCKLVSYHGYLK